MITRFRLPIFLLLFAVAILGANAPRLAAKTGDTTRVNVFDKYLWTYYGTQDRWAKFPDSTKRYERINMHFMLRCPSPACGQWDYTMIVYIRKHTGRMDSTIQKAPSFRINGNVQDSVPVKHDTTWTTKYNTTAKKTDSTANAAETFTHYSNLNQPWVATDSIKVWPAGYWNYYYNNTGKKVDSLYVTADTILRVTYKNAYLPFEVVIPYEIARFITPYGGWFAKDREFDWVYDVTDYASLLRDSVDIQTLYSGYSQGSLYSLDFDCIEGIAPKDVYKVNTIYDGSWTYGDPGNPIESHLPPVTIPIDSHSGVTTLKLTTTGHGFGGTDNAGEFADKTHSINVNGTKRFSQHLWRDDCGQNPVYPQAGTWYYQRGGWCPGDEVHPNYYDLTPYLASGDSATVDYNLESYTNADLSHPATYIIDAQVMYATGPNFTNDAAIEEIKRPTNEFRFRRMNPICAAAAPVLTLRNHGRAPLTSVNISYGVRGQDMHQYKWTGNVTFMDTAEVTLPSIDLGTNSNAFTAVLSQPNGTSDEYQRDDSMTVSYSVPKVSSGTLYLLLKTDNIQNDPATTNGIAYEIRDVNDSILYQRDGFADATINRDTFQLKDGCYQFIIYDNYIGDGLYPIDGSTPGYYQLKDDKNNVIINATGAPNYLSSFGDREITSFTVSSVTGVEQGTNQQDMGELKIFPNPTRGEFTLDMGALKGAARVHVFNSAGTEVYSRLLDHAATVKLDLAGQAAGAYMVRVDASGGAWIEKVILEGK